MLPLKLIFININNINNKMELIKWDAETKIRDPIPWSYSPNCNCGNYTKYVLNPENGFYGSQSYCDKCLDDEYKSLLDENISLKQEEKEKIEISNILNERKKQWGY